MLAADDALAALVIAVDAFVPAVFAVDVTPAAAVCTLVAVCPVELVPVKAVTRLFQVVWMFEAALLSAVPNAVALAAPAAEIALVHCVRAELAFVLAVLAVVCAVPAFVIAVLALLLAVLAVEVIAAAAVCTFAAVCPVTDVPVKALTRLFHSV